MNELILTRENYVVDLLISEKFAFDDVHFEYLIKEQMYKLSIIQRFPTKVLQDKVPIVSVPESNWQWFKSLFGFKHKRRVYTISEHVTFPNFAWPTKLGDFKIYIQTDFYTENNYATNIPYKYDT